MGRSVSEVAARAVKNSQGGERVKPISQRTPEERLANIRNLVAGNLSVPNSELRFLLALYDSNHALLVGENL
jgi:hypothetical protein